MALMMFSQNIAWNDTKVGEENNHVLQLEQTLCSP